MKTGLVMEGGAMRGMYTAGVTDVMMENQIKIDGAIGVSAGAVFGCNYKANQPGRVIRYNTKFCRDPRYVSIRSLLRTGDMYGEQFCYHELPEKLDLFDTKTFSASPMEFYVTCTDAATGKAVYHKCETGNAEDLQWMRASAAMPIVSNIVKIGDLALSDGGIADSIPVQYFAELGYSHSIVILTQPKGFIKQKNRILPALRLALRQYPALISAIEVRHEMYNRTLHYIQEHEQCAELLVIRPSAPIEVGFIERHPERLRSVYELGRRDAEKRLEEMKRFAAEPGSGKPPVKA